ncbi:MAG: hypothetical protein E6G50_02050 [Actinobacteria bacterium]|nr:MAG: hypothetical protein E6G50_02050 [Actinomycetota bacterium]
MPEWLPPLAAASLACLILNVALWVQRARERAKAWPAEFRRELRRWDGRLPERFESEGSDLPV